MSVSRPAVSALTAAQRILDRHSRCQAKSSGLPSSPCADCPDLADAGLVVERIREAEKHLRLVTYLDVTMSPEMADARGLVLAALAALTGGTDD